ncbi:unnamed protein product, partial [Lampetra planeri]
MENGSSAFYLSTFEASYSVQMVIFGLCLLLYVITVVANLLVFVAVLMCPELHKPMYLFLGNMALADIIGCTSSVPKQLQILLTGDTKILYESCLVQMFYVHVFANLESLTLSLMAFDRYVAICHPLRYHTIVTAKKTLGVLVLIWVIATSACMTLALLVTRLNFSDDNRKIQGILCDHMGVVVLAESDIKMVIFGLCLLLYVITVVANLLVFVAVLMCPELHKPMYLLLGNMALVDIIGCTSSVPKQLQILLTGDTKILYESCLVQMFYVHVFANFESLTLSLMAFDRYVAICHPLRYHTIVTAKKTLGVLVLIWVIATPACMTLALLVRTINFSDGNRKIQGIFCDHLGVIMPGIFCDYSGFVRLSIGDTRVYETYILAFVVTLYALPLCVIGHTYARIIIECKRTRSRDFKRKAVHTLLTHFFLLSVFFGSLFIAVLVPRLVRDSQSVQARNIRCVAEFVSFILPIANVSIYFFRTKELRKVAKSRLKKMIPKAFSNLRLRKVC